MTLNVTETIEALDAIREGEGGALLPLFRAHFDGTLLIHQVTTTIAYELDDLARAGLPLVLMLPTEGLAPDAFPVLDDLKTWCRAIVVFAREPVEADLNVVIELTLTEGRILFVSCEAVLGQAWAEALLPNALGYLFHPEGMP